MGRYLYGVFATVIFSIFCKMFCEIFWEKRSRKNKFYYFFLILSFIICTYLVSIAFAKYIIVKGICVLLCSIFFMWMYFRQNIWKTAVGVLMYQGISLISDYTSVLMISKCFPVITRNDLGRLPVNIFGGLLGQAILFFVLICIKKIVKKDAEENLTTKEWLRFVIFPIFTVLVLVALFLGFYVPQNDTQKNILIGIAGGLLLMNIMVFYLIDDILKREVRIRKNEIFLERAEHELEHYKNISQNYEEQRRREHEYTNQMAVIAQLAKNGQIEELNRYLKEYQIKTKRNLEYIDANHVIINAVLNAKYEEAKEKGIVFVVKVSDLSGLKIKDEDIALILSNLLNNAIEASEKCTNPVIKMKLIINEKKQVILSVINTLSIEPVVLNDQFLTSKTDNVKKHGIGIENVQRTVEKYGGSCAIDYDSAFFRFVIYIPDKKGE